MGKGEKIGGAYVEGTWSGEIDDPARLGFDAIDAAIEWRRVNRPKREETSRATIRALDISKRALPTWIEDTHVKAWNDLRDYFVRVCHHGRETDIAEFEAAVYEFERFVLDRMKPRTYREHVSLEQLIAEAESGA